MATLRLIHISDLHFGRVHQAALDGLLRFLKAEALDGLLVTGDLTQRARKGQFQAARRFADGLGPLIKVAVPGNHDMPLFHLFRRFTAPYKLYERFIAQAMPSSYVGSQVAIFGIRTANPWTISEGKLYATEVRAARAFFERPEAQGKVRILLGHHPFHRQAGPEMEALLAGKLDLVLVGHEHETGAELLDRGGHRTAIVSAGTAFSNRLRSGPNAFNLIEIEGGRTRVFAMSFEAASGGFARVPLIDV